MLQAQSRQKDPLLQRLPSRSQLAPMRAPQRVSQPLQGRSLKRQQGKARRCQSRPRTKQQGSRTSSWEARSRCSLSTLSFCKTPHWRVTLKAGCQWQCLSYALVYSNPLKKHTLHAGAGASRQRCQRMGWPPHGEARAWLLDALQSQLFCRNPDGLADPRTASNRARRPCSGRGLFCMQAVRLKMAVQVLEPTSKEGSTRVGGTTLKRERWLLDALQRQVFMRVSAIRALFRVSPLSPPFWAPLHAAACASEIR